MKKLLCFLCLSAVLCATLCIGATPSIASGGAGGGSTKPLEIRVTGYVTAIDYARSTITVGASYYGTGVLNVTSNTKISLNNVNCNFREIQLGDFAEARYDYYTKNANKLSCIRQ